MNDLEHATGTSTSSSLLHALWPTTRRLAAAALLMGRLFMDAVRRRFKEQDGGHCQAVLKVH
jgi:hypothetical protein